MSEDKKRALTSAKINEPVKAAEDLLKKRKRQLMDAEGVLEANHAFRTYSLDDLGHGRSRGGGAAAKKRSLEVLGRLARLGQGLSPAQRNDFRWWKDAWDANMLECHGEDWPRMFAGWVQRILDDHEAGVWNAFPLFVNAETRRCFDGALALHVP